MVPSQHAAYACEYIPKYLLIEEKFLAILKQIADESNNNG